MIDSAGTSDHLGDWGGSGRRRPWTAFSGQCPSGSYSGSTRIIYSGSTVRRMRDTSPSMASFGCGQVESLSLVPREGGGTEGKCAGDETPTLGGGGPGNRDLTDGEGPEDGLGDGGGWGGGPSVWQSVPVRIIESVTTRCGALLELVVVAAASRAVSEHPVPACCGNHHMGVVRLCCCWGMLGAQRVTHVHSACGAYSLYTLYTPTRTPCSLPA
jgi:hypothetical protein